MQSQKRVVIDFPWVEVTFLRIILMLRRLQVRVAQCYRSTDAKPETVHNQELSADVDKDRLTGGDLYNTSITQSIHA